MDYILLITHALFFLLVALILYLLADGREHILGIYHKYKRQFKKLPQDDFTKYDQILSKRNTYYQKLSVNGKHKFISRLIKFNKEKVYEGRRGLEITFEMKVLIGAAAIQLTYGLDNFMLGHIPKIRVYPESFYIAKHRITGKMPPRPGEEEWVKLRGKTSQGGLIGLSWKDFVKGYDIPDDNYNLGLHEMAHALKLSLNQGYDFDDKFSFYLDDWMEIGSEEFRSMGESSSSFLRAYGGTNMHEFFSVCVEHFFESPEQFKNRLPDLYNHLCYLLNQNPVNSKEDYRLSEEFVSKVNLNPDRIPLPEKPRKHYRYHNWHWTLTIIMLGVFPGFISILVAGVLTEFSFGRFLLISGTLVLLATLIQYRYLSQNDVLAVKGFTAYSFLGVVPAFFSLYLLMNYFIPFKPYEEVHQISEVVIERGQFFIELEGNAYRQYPQYRTLPMRNWQSYYEGKPQKVRLKFDAGVFGMRVHKSTVFTGYLYPEAVDD